MKSGRDYTGIILEEIRDQYKVVIEAVGTIQETMKTLATKDDLHRVEKKVDTIQFALTETNNDVRHLDSRVTRLEQAV